MVLLLAEHFDLGTVRFILQAAPRESVSETSFETNSVHTNGEIVANTKS
jgi:hypothetical protein